MGSRRLRHDWSNLAPKFRGLATGWKGLGVLWDGEDAIGRSQEFYFDGKSEMSAHPSGEVGWWNPKPKGRVALEFRSGSWHLVLWNCDHLDSVQSLSPVQLSATPWTAARQASLSITSSQSLLKLMSIESVMPSSHLILCCPLLLLPPAHPSVGVFSSESTLCMRWPKYWSFSFSISPYSEHPGLISFRMDLQDLLVVQGTLKSLLIREA